MPICQKSRGINRRFTRKKRKFSWERGTKEEPEAGETKVRTGGRKGLYLFNFEVWVLKQGLPKYFIGRSVCFIREENEVPPF